jgi:hypothetical protein
LPLVDQTAENLSDVLSLLPEPSVKPAEPDLGAKVIGEDPNIAFAEEREGWHGYVPVQLMQLAIGVACTFSPRSAKC